MNNKERLFDGGIVLVSTLVIACTFSGCQQSARINPQSLSQNPSTKVFYPGPPGKPRLQFLKSISKESDLGATPKQYSGLEKLLAGEEKKVEKQIIYKPYGLALHEGKLYVCDVQRKLVEVLDLQEKTFGFLTKERRMLNPVNICIEDGRKYVADPTAGKVFVFNRNNDLVAMLGGDSEIKPIDVAVRGKRCYITDMNGNQVVVLDVTTGKEIMRVGKAGDGPGQLGLIGDVALDAEENIYVTDKALGRITKFDSKGAFRQTIGKAGDSIHDFVRPKGIDVDREGRIWVVDAAAEVGKVYNSEGQLLMFFGFPGGKPGNTNLPASIAIDYDNVESFGKHFAEGARIEFLVLVSSQYGAKINVYGFGSFPLQEKAIEEAAGNLDAEWKPERKAE